MKATISPKLLALVFASLLLLDVCVQAAGREDSEEATFTTIDFPHATSTAPRDISAAGEIVGRYDSAADGNTHGFLRSKDGEFTTIDVPGAVFSVAAGINARGDIVGWYRLTANAVTHGFLLSRGTFTTIDFPGTTITQLNGINSRGDIVGRRCPFLPCGRGAHGFLLSRGEFTSIDVPGTLDEIHAWKINDRGQIVGGYAGADGKNHVFLLRKGEFTTIDFSVTIAINFTGGISPGGDIVGVYCDSATCMFGSTDLHGFLLSRGVIRGEFTTIDVPGATWTAAFGINGCGDIAGTYIDTNGKQHGFLLSRKEEDEDDLGSLCRTDWNTFKTQR